MSAPVYEDAPLVSRRMDADAHPCGGLVLAHGVGGNEENLAPLGARAPADPEVLLVRAPRVLGRAQYTWFPVVFTPQGPQPDLDAAERRIEFVSSLQARPGVLPTRTLISGFRAAS